MGGGLRQAQGHRGKAHTGQLVPLREVVALRPEDRAVEEGVFCQVVLNKWGCGGNLGPRLEARLPARRHPWPSRPDRSIMAQRRPAAAGMLSHLPMFLA